MLPDIDPLYLFYGLAALAAALVGEALYLLFHNANSYRTRVNRRLQISGKEASREKVLVQLRRERGLAANGDNALPLASLNRLVVQSGFTLTAARLIALVGGSALVGFIGTKLAVGDAVEALGGALAATTALPVAALLFLRKRRRQKFAEQFPEAIDIIVRSLRAGHPVPVAIAMVSRELADPVGTEFGLAADEITYGSDLEGAMRNMLFRVGQEDLPLFVTSVAIQSTTGGNLSQILENLSKVIRERFKMRRKIKGLSAEGRAGAMILNLTPLAVFVLINLMSPEFYGSVWDRPAVQYGLCGAAFWMFLGNMIMRRMINFKI